MSGTAGLVLALVAVTSCGAVTSLSPAGPSEDGKAGKAAIDPTTSHRPEHIVAGTVGPLQRGAEPCFAQRYPCAVYEFALAREGPIEVTLTWNDAPRALFVQLYWAGEGLAHEDVAPRSGPPRISFTRPRMEAARYEVRVVSLEPDRAIPFTLTVSW